MIFIAIPESISVNLLAGSLLGNKLKLNTIIKIALIFGLGCYFIKNIAPTEINLVLSFILMTGLYNIYSNIDLKYCFIAEISAFGVKFFAELLLVTALNLGGVSVESLFTNQYLKIIMSTIPSITVLVLYIILSKRNINIINYKHNTITIKKNGLKMLTLFGIVNLIIMSGILLLTTYENYQDYLTHNMLINIITSIAILCISTLIIVASILYKNKSMIEIEHNLMVKSMKQMEETVDLLRIQKHDYMNHLQVILMQIDKGTSSDVKNYILGISNEANSKISSFDTGNNYIDAILNFKHGKCADNGIELTACIDSMLEDTTLLDIHISAIILNIIDNAIDELKINKKDNKYIHVDTYIDNYLHHISIKNNGSKIENINKIFEKGYSSKGENRGYGLYSIKKILESNNCTIEVYSEDDETEFMIKLPIVKLA